MLPQQGRRLSASEPGRILLASEGRPFSVAAIELSATLSGNSGGHISVLSIARIWGSAFGFPNPWLLPAKHEWQEQYRIVDDAVRALSVLEIEATAQVTSTRNAGKRILAEAHRLACEAIVMGADAPRHWLISDFIWSQEPQRVKKRAKIPVYLSIHPAVATLV